MRLINTTDPAWPTIASVLHEMANAGVEIDETAYGIAAKVGAYRYDISLPKTGRRYGLQYYQATLTGTGGSIVYYIRRGELIKIGTTVDPVQRFSTLLPSEILAFEPGTDELEKIRHQQFDHLRCRGEHFREAPELLEHARHLRRLHGDPDPSWPIVTPVKRAPVAMPVLVTHETVTADEAAARFGIHVSTVSRWVSRGLIRPVGQNERRARLYYAEHLATLQSRSRALKRRPEN